MTQLSLFLQQQYFNRLQVLGRQGDSTRYRKKDPQAPLGKLFAKKTQSTVTEPFIALEQM